MQTSKEGIEQIKFSEGLRTKPYLCQANVPTIGYGCTFYEDGTKVTLKDKAITSAKADKLFMLILPKFEKEVNALVKVKLTQGQFDALMSFAFNFGAAQLGKSTLLRKLNAGDYAGAAEEFPRWKFASGVESDGLIARRAREKALFLK